MPTLTAKMTTSFKGETHHLEGQLDLDKLHYDPENPIQVYHHIATQNNIDQYSYLYELMEMEPIEYQSDDPLVQACISEDRLHFDWQCYETKRQQQKAREATQALLNQYVDAELQKQAPQLADALRDAYLLGCQQCRTS